MSGPDAVALVASVLALAVLAAVLVGIAHSDHAAQHPDDSPGATSEWADQLARMNREDEARAERATRPDTRRCEHEDVAACATCGGPIVYRDAGGIQWWSHATQRDHQAVPA